jgi:ABC-type dipeptide/oligopeptide/nickel transport system permease subunit
LAVIAAAAIVAPLLAPYAPDALDLANRRAAPSLVHWFGTDDLAATRSVAPLRRPGIDCHWPAVGAGGSSSRRGRSARWRATSEAGPDTVLMRATDAVLSVPRLLLLMVAAAVCSRPCRRL